MAKSKEKATSKSAYFREIYQSNPDLLDESNEVVLERWQREHPNEELTQQVRNSLANVKSQERKKMGKTRRRKRRKHGAAPAAASAEPRVGRPRSSHTALEDLEGQIDEALMLARRQNSSEGMERVIKHLRLARRGVAWEMGQPAAVKE
jgi:hypothetical protein